MSRISGGTDSSDWVSTSGQPTTKTGEESSDWVSNSTSPVTSTSTSSSPDLSSLGFSNDDKGLLKNPYSGSQQNPYQNIRNVFTNHFAKGDVTAEDIGRATSGVVVNELKQSKTFPGLSPQDQQNIYLQRLQQELPPEIAKNVIGEGFGIDYTKGSTTSGLSAAGLALGRALQDITAPLYRAVSADPSKGSLGDFNQNTVNPLDTKSNTTGKVIGGAAPIIAAGSINPIAGVGVGAAQGAGSAINEGTKEGYSAGQTAALATERAAFNALIGLIPGGKGIVGGGLAGVVKNVAKGTIQMGAINLTQAALESQVKQTVGIKDEGTWNSVKDAAASGETWAQALLFGGVHAVNVKLNGPPPVGEGAKSGAPNTPLDNTPSIPGASPQDLIAQTRQQNQIESLRQAQQAGGQLNPTAYKTGPGVETTLDNQGKVLSGDKNIPSPTKTVYIDPKDAAAISTHTPTDGKFVISTSPDIKPGDFRGTTLQDTGTSIVPGSYDYSGNVSPGTGKVPVPYTEIPEVGKVPVQMWGTDIGVKSGSYSTDWRVGQPITEVTRPPVSSTEALATKTSSLGNEGSTSPLTGETEGQVRAKVVSAETSGDQEVNPNPAKVVGSDGDQSQSLGGGLVTKLSGSWFHEPLVDRVERMGQGNPVTTEASQKLRTVYDQSKVLKSSVEDQLNPAMKVAGKLSKLTTWLNQVEKQGDGSYGIRNLVLALENGKAPPLGTEGDLNKISVGNRAIGDMWSKVDPEFKSSGQVQNLATGGFMDIIRHPDTAAWNKVVDAFYDANKESVDSRMTVEKSFRDLNQQFSDSDYAGVTRAINQEFKRVLPVHPSAVKVPGLLGLSNWVDLYHHNVFDYLSTAADRVSSRAAFKTVFGSGDQFGDFAKSVRAVNPESGTAFDNAVKAVHGIPTDDPGMGLSQGLQLYDRYVGRPLAGVGLSLAGVAQLADALVGNTQAFYGIKNSILGAAKLLRQGNYQDLRSQGKLVRNFYDLSWDPTSPVRTIAKYVATGGSFITQLTSHLQDNLHASTAQVWADRLQSGDLSNGEKGRAQEILIQLGFGKDVVKDLVNGEGTQPQYDAIVRQSMPYFTSGGKSSGETTSALGSRVFNTMFKYMSYPATQMNVATRALRGVVDAVQSKDTGRMNSATQVFGRTVLSLGVRGALTGMLLTALTGGQQGMKIAVNQDQDEPGKFFLDSLAYGIGGPAMVAYRALNNWTDSQSVVKSVTRMSQPVSAVLDTLDYIHGTGQYENKTTLEKAQTFIGQRIPLVRALSSWIAIDGLGSKNTSLDTGLRAVSQWKAQQNVVQDQASGGTDGQLAFRVTMRRAAEIIKRGGDPTELLQKELNVQPGDTLGVSSSLEGKMVLRGLTPDQKTSLKNYIGQDAFNEIQSYDDTLAGWAEQFRPAQTISQTLGAGVGKQFITAPSGPDELQNNIDLAKTKSQISEMEHENRNSISQ